jgi:hypothetical protein
VRQLRQQQERRPGRSRQNGIGHGGWNPGLPADRTAHPIHTGDAAPKTKEKEVAVKSAMRTARAPGKTAGQQEEKVSRADHGGAAITDAKETAEERSFLAHGQQRHPCWNQNL